MPNTREKLIELLFDCVSENLTPEQKSSNRLTIEIHHGDIADHLIANGVTVLDCPKDCANCWKTKLVNAPNRWIPVTERLPQNVGLYLVIEKHWIDGSPCRRIAKWNTVDWFTADRKSKEITPRVTHWMPLPEPPMER